MRKISYISFLFLLIGTSGYSQQSAQFSQYLYNCGSINPAFNGQNDRIGFLLMHRSQWMGLEGAPSSQLFNFDMPLMNQKITAGLYVFNESIGARRFSTAQARGAYHINMNGSMLSFGFRAGIFNWHINQSDLLYETTSDPSSLVNAPNAMVPNFDAGMFYYGKKFLGGISSFNLTEPDFYTSTSAMSIETGNRLKRHYFAIVGYKIQLNDNLVLRPSALLKYADGAPFNFDINMALIVKEKFHAAVTYRSSQMISAMLQFYFNGHLHAGYSFDYTLSELQQFAGMGTHEIFIGYDIFLKSKPMVTPRFL